MNPSPGLGQPATTTRPELAGLGARTVRPPWYGGHGRRTVGRGAARGRPGRAARPVTPTSVPVPGRGGRAEAVVGWLGRARRRRGRDVAASPTAKPRGRAAERVVGTGSGSRDPRRSAGGGLAPLFPPSRRGRRARRRCAVSPPPTVKRFPRRPWSVGLAGGAKTAAWVRGPAPFDRVAHG